MGFPPVFRPGVLLFKILASPLRIGLIDESKRQAGEDFE